MDMQGSRTLAVTVQQAWEALNDPAMLQACIPGCERFELTEPDTYAITTVVKIGPVSARFNGRLKLSDIVPMQSYKIGFEAQGGAAGFGKGDASVQLTPTDTGCTLTYQVHSAVGGKIAQLGQRLIEGASKSLAEDFFRRFDQALQTRYPSAEAAAPATPEAPVAAAGVPVWVWAAAAVAGAGLIYLASRS